MDATRRGFLSGVGVVLVAAAIKSVPPPDAEVIGGSRFALIPPEYSGMLTYRVLANALSGLFKQVTDIASKRVLSVEEKAELALLVEEALDYVRPPSLRIDVLIPFEEMITGGFVIRESFEEPGVVRISSLSALQQSC